MSDRSMYTANGNGESDSALPMRKSTMELKGKKKWKHDTKR